MKFSNFNIIKEYKENELLVYNSYTKASVIIEDSHKKIFGNVAEFKKLDKTVQNIFIENGFVIEDNRNEFLELKYLFEKKYFDNQTLNIATIPTLKCNFNCPYCCEKGCYSFKDNIKKYFDYLKLYASKYFKNKKNVQISLFGGEPLLNINSSLEFLNWVNINSQKEGYSYLTTIVTNGSLLNKNIINGLLHHNLKNMQITIDSDKENHDKMRIFKNGDISFDLLINKIKLVIDLTKNQKDFKFVLRINLNNTNVEKLYNSLIVIDESYRNKINLLIRVVYNTHEYHKENTNNIFNLEEYYEKGKELGFNILNEECNYQSCEACADNKFFYLLPDLSMWKCINDLSYKKACIGKINFKGDTELIPENIVEWYNKASSAFIDTECINCKTLPDCLGSCIMYKCKNNKKKCASFDMTSKAFMY